MTVAFAPVASAAMPWRDYKVWLCDVWGVVHNGTSANPVTCRALRNHRAEGGVVVLTTNAPRPWRAVAPQLERLGATDDIYDAIITSGDVTRNLLREHAGKTAFHLGPQRDNGLREEAPVTFAAFDESEIVLCTGLFDDETDSLADYDELLSQMHSRGMAMICANPDRVVRKGDRLFPCAGALAERFARLGGEVFMAGKPYAPIYRQALQKAADALGRSPVKSEVLAIGDSIATDIAGAASFGIASLFVVDGIHAQSLRDHHVSEIERRIRAQLPDVTLAGIVPELAWSA